MFYGSQLESDLDHTSALPLPCWSSTGFAGVTEGVLVHVVVPMEAWYRAHPDLAHTTGIQSIDSVCVNSTLRLCFVLHGGMLQCPVETHIS